MYESALLASGIAAFIAFVFAPRSFEELDRANPTFTLFGVASALRFGNIYFWLNMTSSNPLYLPLRALDFLLVVPISALGVEMLHFHALARVKEVDPNLRRIYLLVFSAIMVTLSALLFVFDIQTVRLIALSTAFPVILIITATYLVVFRDNPLRIARPELVWGSILIFTGYFLYFGGEGFIAGFLRMLDLALSVQIIGLILIGGGGIARRIVSFVGIYSRLNVDTILVDQNQNVTMTTVGHENLSGERALRVANEIVDMHKQEIGQVFETGNKYVVPYCSLESYKPDRLFQIEIVPHRINIKGNPDSIAIVLSDVTVSIEEKEKEQLAELLNEVVKERNRAEFYLDLLTHDMGNLLQGILGGVQLMAEKQKISHEKSPSYQLIMNQLNESIRLIRQVRHIGIESDDMGDSKPLTVRIVLQESLDKVRAMFPDRKITLRIIQAYEPIAANNPVPLEQGLVSLFRYIAHSDETNVKIKVSLDSVDKKSQIKIFTSETGAFDNLASDAFKWSTERSE
ncbi:MAG: HAMP domain-containing histidine kinase, partial [Candidatus Thorarchaeota archaeon]|nr:HAMP domain-containing histidine kinase [Candidatus Thorarchaeota archaeon]